jgi:O-antigen biosynthesis protein
VERILGSITHPPAVSIGTAGLLLGSLVRLSPGIVMIGMPQSVAELASGPIILRTESGPIAPPMSWQRLVLGGRKTLLLIARDQSGLSAGQNLELGDSSGATLRLRLGDEGELAGFVGTADPAGVLALLRFIASKATGVLRHSEDAGLAETCHLLADTVMSPGRVALPAAGCGQDMVLWTLPVSIDARAGPCFAVSRRRLRRLHVVGDTVVLPDRPFEGGYLLPPGGEGPIQLAPASGRLPSLGDLAKRKDRASHALYRRGLADLGRRAESDPAIRRLLRDLQLFAPKERPRHYAQPAKPFGASLELALWDHAGGVFLRGWLRDPLSLITGLSLRSEHGQTPLPMAKLGRFARPDLAKRYAEAPHGGAGSRPGFALHLPEAGFRPAAQWSMRVSLTTGDAVTLIAPPGLLDPQRAREAVLGSISPADITPELFESAIVPPVARLHAAAMAARLPPEIVRIGKPPADPIASIIVPLYRNLRFLRHQLAAFGRDRTLRDVELIYVLDSPEQRAEVEHLLRGLAGIIGQPIVLVVQATNYGYACACNAGAAEARAPILLLLNSDVVPAARGWLPPLLSALARKRRLVAVGPKLLFEDQSLQHAGLFFERGPNDEWFNSHYYKGFPRHHPPADEVRLVPGVTGAALCVRRQAFEAVGGFTTDYVIGDYEDSDLCLKLRAGGGEIAYIPRSELFHFERQSIRDHTGYARTLAATYNRRLHHARWAPTIAALMARAGKTDRRAAARAR